MGKSAQTLKTDIDINIDTNQEIMMVNFLRGVMTLGSRATNMAQELTSKNNFSTKDSIVDVQELKNIQAIIEESVEIIFCDDSAVEGVNKVIKFMMEDMLKHSIESLKEKQTQKEN